MNIELKNVKYAAFASEETSCFEAAVYVDGKRAGDVSNEGRGGCHRWHPHTLQASVEAYAKTLPEIVTDMADPKEPTKAFTFQPGADTVIDRLLMDHLHRKDLKRLLATRFLFVRDGECRQSKKYTAAQMAQLLAAAKANPGELAERLKATTVLNLLPFEEALQQYLKATAQG